MSTRPYQLLLRATGAGIAWCLASSHSEAFDSYASGNVCTPCSRLQDHPPGQPYGPPPRRPRPQPPIAYSPPDRPAPRPILGPVEPGSLLAPPAPIWSGLYLGGHVAYDVGTIQLSGLGNMGVDGSAIGIHFGHNWQQGQLVLGIEMDTSVSRASGGLSTSGYQLSGEAGIFSSLRGRAGLVIDNMLLYGTAGFGVAHLEAGTGTGHASATLPAFVFGAGIEWKHSAPISLRLEALYWELGERNVDLGLGNRALDGAFGTLRAGLTFHFN